MKELKSVGGIAAVLTLIGGFNWGFVGLEHFTGFGGNLVNLALGSYPTVEYVVYLLVGLSAIVMAVTHGKCCGK